MTIKFEKILLAFAVTLFIQSCSTPTAPSTEIPLISPTKSVILPVIAPPTAPQGTITDAAPTIVTAPASPSANEAVDTSNPDFWKALPIIPEHVSPRVLEIYQRGLDMGNNPNAFSKIGNCNSTIPYFLTNYDGGPNDYNLGEFEDLQITIDYFSGSYGRKSLAAKVGMSTAGALASLWADWNHCSSTETPLDCEYRIHRPR